ncbi:hemolysin-III related-domain-containing protein [Kalaharituber pfeilii]|nr:hemolysin-III related-domain-containing protein [Kalaharituber pfeilii]
MGAQQHYDGHHGSDQRDGNDTQDSYAHGRSAREMIEKFEARAVEVAHAAEGKIERALTCLFEDLRTDNHFILSYYRPPSYSLLTSFRSLLYLHNESINIYTHLLGAIVALCLPYYIFTLLSPRYPTMHPLDTIALLSFLLGSGTCLFLSATYHTVSNHSRPLARLGNTLDYIGIVAMIFGSYIGSLTYGFWCLPALRTRYTAVIGGLGLICSILALHPHFRTPKYRPFRATMYILYGSSGIVPIIHGSRILGFSDLSAQIQLRWLLAQGGLYILGALIYAARVPERWAPGRFDLFGASHQVFHVLVLAAAGTHLRGLIRAFDYRHGVVGVECPAIAV